MSAAETDGDQDDLGSLASLAGRLARTDDVAALMPGAVIADQYRIEQVLGAGGMAVVFLARDLRLDRSVAIKLGHALSAEGLRRLGREAVALARLSHPNVVVVHQVGELDGRVFLAMEHVTGGTARSWVAERPRSWREILDLYLAAGEGLAAAHGAGMIHRDFKPDNVLVGDDGRPRVADFGLVGADPHGRVAGDLAVGGDTRTGALVGTPAYMAPEQLDGGDVDARADQFAFAASLWEALFGARPYPGDSVDELRGAIVGTAPRTGKRRLPAAIPAALRRALSARREARFPDLRALLTALRRGRDRRRRLLIAAGAAVVVAGAAAAFVVGQRSAHPPDPCTDGPAQIATVWNPARAARLAARLPPATWTRLGPALDDYAHRWALGHRDACRATRVARSQSEEVLDRRTTCLAVAAGNFDAQLVRLETSPGGRKLTVDDVTAALPALSVCAHVEQVGSQEPPPAGIDRAALLAAISATASAENQAIDADVSAGAATAHALALARATGWRPQIARALIADASARYNTGEYQACVDELEEAADLALRSRSDRDVAFALADLAWSLVQLDRVVEADDGVRLAAAIASRMPDDRIVQRRVILGRLMVTHAEKRWPEMIEAARANVAIVGEAPTLRAYTLADLADLLLEAGQPAEAVTAADEALRLLTGELGGEHPRVARIREKLADAQLATGRLDDAAAGAADALAVFDARGLFTDQHDAHDLLARIARARGDTAGAAAEDTAARAAADRKAVSADVAARSHQADADLAAGRWQAVIDRLQPLLATVEERLGKDAFELVDVLIALGRAAGGLGHFDEARGDLERAAAIAAARRGAISAAGFTATRALASLDVAKGKPAAAIALLTPLVTTVDDHADELPESLPAELRIDLADAAWAAGDRDAARQWADGAAATHGIGVHGIVDAWRAAHP